MFAQLKDLILQRPGGFSNQVPTKAPVVNIPPAIKSKPKSMPVLEVRTKPEGTSTIQGNKTLSDMVANRNRHMYIGPKSTSWHESDEGKFSNLHDKMERREISDRESFVVSPDLWKNPYDPIKENKPTNKLQDILRHGELFKEYPDLNPDVEFDPDMGNRATFYNKKNKISIGSPDTALMLHEIQHAIQEKEGWASGSSVSTEREIRLNDIAKNYNKLSSSFVKKYGNIGNLMKKIPAYDDKTKLMNKLWDENEKFKKIKDSNSFGVEKKRYWKSAGEVEARDTENRYRMPIEMRRQKPPLTYQGIPLKDMIVRRHENE